MILIQSKLYWKNKIIEKIFKLCAVDAQTTSINKIMKIIKYYGGVIIRILIYKKILEKINNNIKSYFRDSCNNPFFY